MQVNAVVFFLQVLHTDKLVAVFGRYMIYSVSNVGKAIAINLYFL